ncbi:MAG: hypothetical protein LQ349_000109 [Xanthoria aureola]|nr:MAG: hypothetical protein LQ349_000109 [Xanthoria aureola]
MIDQQYDVAISTACPSLDNLVVDSVEVGQQCIDYLRKNNLVRPNFILLDRLAQRDLSAIDTPEGVPRLFDLVKPKNFIFQSGFFSVLQNTLVTKDLERTNRIAYGARRWRVERSADRRFRLDRGFQAFQEGQRATEASLQELTEQIPQIEMKMQEVGLEVESIARNLADTERRLSEFTDTQQPSASDKPRINTLEKQLSKLNKEVDKLRAETAGIEAEIQILQSKIMEAGGVRLRSQKAKVDGLNEYFSTLAEEIPNAESRIRLDRREKLKKLESYADHPGFRQELDLKQEQLATLKSELDQKTVELNENRAVEIDIRNNLAESHKVLSENQKRLVYWTDKVSMLALQSTSYLDGEHSVEELPQYTKDELADMDKESLKAEIAILEEKTQNNNVDLGVLAEYRRRVEEYTARFGDLQSAVSGRDAAKKRCDDLRRLRLEGFMQGFSLISLRLKEMYQMITMGGNAELELVDSLDPFSEGILFSVMPPKKSWKNISNLSGGEKTLSSLALVFALHHYKPTPLYVMDEIDAALDFRNVSIVASYIKERTKNAQFIVISLRNNMFELASRLVGVYKVNHMTKSVTVENRDYINRSA